MNQYSYYAVTIATHNNRTANTNFTDWRVNWDHCVQLLWYYRKLWRKKRVIYHQVWSQKEHKLLANWQQVPLRSSTVAIESFVSQHQTHCLLLLQHASYMTQTFTRYTLIKNKLKN